MTNEDGPAAANPFEIAAPKYAEVRPAYPSSVVDRLLKTTRESLGRTPARAADIGAGTGKMTGLLAARGLVVDAVEPSEAMLVQMRDALADEVGAGRVVPRAVTAESTGLPDAATDLVVAAQSWHWVDEALAAAEAARVLAPRGVLAVVWNQMDVSIPWVKRLTRIMRSGDVHRPENPPTLGEAFTCPVLAMESWEDRMTTDALLELGTTRSSYLRQGAAGRARMQANLRWYLYEHRGFAEGDLVAIPYSTMVWTASLR